MTAGQIIRIAQAIGRALDGKHDMNDVVVLAYMATKEIEKEFEEDARRESAAADFERALWR
jgi:hypothetical protein